MRHRRAAVEARCVCLREHVRVCARTRVCVRARAMNRAHVCPRLNRRTNPTHAAKHRAWPATDTPAVACVRLTVRTRSKLGRPGTRRMLQAIMAIEGVIAGGSALVLSGTKGDSAEENKTEALWFGLLDMNETELQEFLKHEQGADLPESLAEHFLAWRGETFWFATMDKLLRLGLPRWRAGALLNRLREHHIALARKTRPGFTRFSRFEFNPNLNYPFDPLILYGRR